jgi:hypothetical protein
VARGSAGMAPAQTTRAGDAREALQANEAVTRSNVEASPDCVALLDPEGSVSSSIRLQSLALPAPTEAHGSAARGVKLSLHLCVDPP